VRQGEKPAQQNQFDELAMGGIDVGTKTVAALSDGTFIENPRFYQKAEEKLVALQQAVSNRKRGSNRRKKAIAKLAKHHHYIANMRKDYSHKESRKIVTKGDAIFFEDLKIANRVRRPKPKENPDNPGHFDPNGAARKAGLNKSILDAAWGMLYQFTLYKAEDAGKMCMKVNPNYTSQVCHYCSAFADVKLTLNKRVFECEHCQEVSDRDTNAAINIRARGMALLKEKGQVLSFGLKSEKPTLATTTIATKEDAISNNKANAAKTTNSTTITREAVQQHVDTLPLARIEAGNTAKASKEVVQHKRKKAQKTEPLAIQLTLDFK
jgi:transposase